MTYDFIILLHHIYIIMLHHTVADPSPEGSKPA